MISIQESYLLGIRAGLYDHNAQIVAKKLATNKFVTLIQIIEQKFFLLLVAVAAVERPVVRNEAVKAVAAGDVGSIDDTVAITEYGTELLLSPLTSTTPLLPALRTSPPESVMGCAPTVAVVPPTMTTVEP